MGQDRPELGERSLARAVAVAIEADTAQLVIMRDGDVLVDEAPHGEAVDVFAVQKGLVAVLVGIAQGHGLLAIDDPLSAHLGTGWTQLPEEAEEALTIRTVLDMTTGVDDALRPLGETGLSWRYDNISYNYLKTVLEAVTGLALDELSRSWLFGPLDMASSRWVDRPVLRPDGRPISGLLSTARDLAAFGAMVLRGGDGLAPAEWLGLLGRPGSDENPAWGLCWWNNDHPHHRLPGRESEPRQGRVTPEAPTDLLAARGAMENYLYLVPSLDLVVARTARPVRRGTRPVRFDRPFWQTLLGEPT